MKELGDIENGRIRLGFKIKNYILGGGWEGSGDMKTLSAGNCRGDEEFHHTNSLQDYCQNYAEVRKD